ncbi:MAG: excinuclease ABC subunit C [Candidatus Nealsonbacteria bacterium CG_4_10_14_0_2_um_filter_40_15]|uniref:Excinuclease ABC subunit C n=2 Tax=Candidatus Nealsoniibacteriota TaxID=1817911 RepID=A0A2M7D7S5_9BACT|nr:MAG: excinuclease ABC subunit C [Candidatus Nealsonbacteria bacterium CG02_land_8_20_14_3_00_40_11]PIZ86899.1 MAG: excinuclease ABC subunit C [Candidatus Nealsonbacteria bacterium CG_4_10_14_0_2_um_filter_40_15]
MYYVYILKLERNNKFYIGYTKDLIKRIEQHKSKNKFQLIYYESYSVEELARSRERKLKYYGSAWRALKKRIMA